MSFTSCPGEFAFASPEPGRAASGTCLANKGVPSAFVKQSEVSHILGCITASAVQPENMRLTKAGRARSLHSITKGKLSCVEFAEGVAAPGGYSTIGYFTLGNIESIGTTASSLVPY